ncbi:MAG: hypothetical protein IRY99_08400 [Isosphaeraceae bacterium]|nr:hypothetical protein [Isosphaeraceae bacterium]
MLWDLYILQPTGQQRQASLEAPTAAEAVRRFLGSCPLPVDRGLVSAVPQGQEPARPRPNLSDLTPGQDGWDAALDAATRAYALDAVALARRLAHLVEQLDMARELIEAGAPKAAAQTLAITAAMLRAELQDVERSAAEVEAECVRGSASVRLAAVSSN